MATPTFSAKLPDVTLSQLEELAAQFGVSKSQIVIQAVRQLHQKEIKTMTTPNYAQLAKTRVINDDDLGPESDILLEYDWDNQEEHLEWVATADKAEILSWIMAIRNAENAVQTNAEGE
jgi:predicted transcriptional regulator